MIYAKVVADSISPDGIRITTLEVQAPKYLDAEFEKHRMLSSNSSSSRAIPFGKIKDIYIPDDIRRAQKGMQGDEQLSEEGKEDFQLDVESMFHFSFNKLFRWKVFVHKQHLNRYLEPWTLQKKIVTATEWDNFFKLRLSPDAQPEMQELAKCMKQAMDGSTPTPIPRGAWHLPYIGQNDLKANLKLDALIKFSVARCARVSYNLHDGTEPNIEKDVKLYTQLLESGHLTPFEHQAAPMENTNGKYSDGYLDPRYWERGVTHADRSGNLWSGNFRGWLQNRQLVSEWNG